MLFYSMNNIELVDRLGQKYMYPKGKTFKEICFILDHKLNLKRLGITTTVLTDTLWGEAVVRGDQQLEETIPP